MEVLFLGTGASEGIPGVFCNCRICQNARKKGGKEVRLRTSVLIDGVMMVDVSPDLIPCTHKYGLQMRDLEYLLITHSHSDHLNAEDLGSRKWFWCNEAPKTLNVYGNEVPVEMVKSKLAEYRTDHTATYQTVQDRVPFKLGDYTITPFAVEHMLNENCFTYLIEKDGKTYFHGTDSGEILESTFEYLKENKIHIDVYAIDCTYTFLTTNYGGHMNLLQNAKMKDRLTEIGAFDEKSRMIATHIAMAGQATHKELVKEAKKYGIEVSYDGMKVKI